ncbi:hypothetical protein C9927_03670 [Pseudidiomarina aestuarii]|uniref:Inner membrane protein YejM N-terminal domain-containing protein n=1 Tax=Pseudidiomarina aestuarii TaxID=624146 RepID=A0A2T4D450_9GAMM|nr:hypothetical protein C9927_03670 [Pseudidiomarina aestuarii]
MFYTPITKQDDLFPLSYPTTAKTLMNKHGLLDDQQAVTTDRLLREIDTLELTYPSAALLCAKQANVVDTLIVTMDVLDTNSVEQITGLQAMTWPVLGQLDATSGAFELRYGLPDLYMAAMAKAQQEPAYIDRLQDYDIRIVSSLPTAVEEDSNTIWWAQLERVSATDMRAVETAIESGMRVFVLGLTNQKAPAQGFSEDSMQVPLYVANVELQAQQLTQLVDIMPTVVGHYMNCAEGTKTWSLGQDIAKHDTEWPMIASYGSQLVIYTEAERIVIDQDATTRMFQGTEEMPNAVPPTPILINALRDVKRFSATGE